MHKALSLLVSPEIVRLKTWIMEKLFVQNITELLPESKKNCTNVEKGRK